MFLLDTSDWIRLEILAWLVTPFTVLGVAALLDRLWTGRR